MSGLIRQRNTPLNDKGRRIDTTGVWRSSDTTALVVDGQGRIWGSAIGRTATINVEVGRVTGSKVITVGDDARMGYALADRPDAAGSYEPDPAYRFNSSGNVIEITHSSVGDYGVRFAGLGRTSGQRDNLQVTGYGGTPGTFCKLGGWESTGSDIVADVRCFTLAGAPANSRFTVLLSGGRVYVPGSRLGFVLSPDFNGAPALNVDTAATVRNNATGIVQMGHNGTGDYTVVFPGLERVQGSGPETIQVTAVGTGPERCRVGAIDVPHAGLQVICSAGASPADSRFRVLYLSRGRPYPMRFGYALANGLATTIDYTPNQAFWRNNYGGTITARQLGTGTYRVLFGMLGRAPGATETILLRPFAADRTCTTSAWGNVVPNDLEVKVACFDAAGLPANTQFFILLLQ